MAARKFLFEGTAARKLRTQTSEIRCVLIPFVHIHGKTSHRRLGRHKQHLYLYELLAMAYGNC
jgi:hypothetical protein